MKNNFENPPKRHNTNHITPKNVQQNDIYWAPLTMHDGNVKERPVIVILSKVGKDPNSVAVMPITSKMFTKSDYISKQYAEIPDWKQIGLSKPSYVDTHPDNMQVIEKDDLDDRGHFGHMNPTTQRNVNRSINAMTREKQQQTEKQEAKDLGFR